MQINSVDVNFSVIERVDREMMRQIGKDDQAPQLIYPYSDGSFDGFRREEYLQKILFHLERIEMLLEKRT